jgi:hypothetical protein
MANSKNSDSLTALEKRAYERMKIGVRERRVSVTRKVLGKKRLDGKKHRAQFDYKISNRGLGKLKRKYPELYERACKEVGESRQKAAGKRRAKMRRTKEAKKSQQNLEKVAEQADLDDALRVKRELAQRELSRRYLIASILRFNPTYLAGWVHKDICERLEKFMKAVEAGENPRLMLQMPPRHGKSMIASQEFPAWLLGHHPDWELIVCSYAESLALDFSRNVRERMRDKEFGVLFPDTRLDRDNQNAQGWKLTKKGGFLPAGVGGPITGKGRRRRIRDSHQEVVYLSFKPAGTLTISLDA